MERRVLVTGATSGIGLATIVHLADLGFRTIGSARSADKAGELRETAKRSGVDVDTIVLELTDPRAGEDIVPALGLWGLVNNAGTMNVGTVEDVSLSAARAQLEAMVLAPMHLAQLVLPGMRAAGEGRLVTISSLASHVTGPMLGWYHASKHAASALTDALRNEVASFGIDVVTIEPGRHRTNIWGRAQRDLLDRKSASAYADSYDAGLDVLQRLEPGLPEPQRVAAVVGEAMTAGSPRRRYRVGADAVTLGALDSVAPTALADRVKRSILRL